MRILAFAASLRSDSYNNKLVEAAASAARKHGADVEIADFREFGMPLYDADLNEEVGLPPGALALKQQIEEVEALIIASPEYNYSISGVLKNAIDWVSRARPMPWRGKSIYLMSASPSVMGGIRGLWQTRIPFEGCGALVFPDMFALPNAHQAFDAEGRLLSPATAANLEREMLGFVRLAEAVTPICSEAAATSAAASRRRREITAALEDETSIQPRP